MAAGQHRKITFDVRSGDPSIPDENGNIVLDGESEGTPLGNGLYLVADVVNETINGNVDSDEKGDGNAQRPGGNGGGDDPQPPIGDGPITITSALDFDSPMKPEAGLDGKVTIKVDPADGNSIQNLFVQINSDNNGFMSAASEFVPLSFDLANLSEEDASKIGSLGFPYNDHVKGLTEVEFDITPFIELLGNFEGKHEFVITVKDAKGNTLERTITFVV